MPERKREHTKVLKPSTLGSRIADKRAELGLTQAEAVAAIAAAKKKMGMPVNKNSRSALAQHERDASEPSIDTIIAMAEVYGTTAEFIAFGVKSGAEGQEGKPFTVNEYAFGSSPADRILVDSWGYPRSWLEQEVNTHRPEDLLVYKVQYPQVDGYEHNDRVIVDTGSTKITPPGVFLHWDGVGPTISHLSVAHGANAKKLMARVKTKDDTYEIEADKLQIIGRVLVAVKGR